MGLAPGLTTEENLALKAFRDPPYSRGGGSWQSLPRTRRASDRGVRHPRRSPGLPIRLLSGGNLQKALLAREVELRPKVL